MDLHGEIMNIQVTKGAQNKAIDSALKTFKNYRDILVSAYQCGHRDARHAAAELALKYRDGSLKMSGTIHIIPVGEEHPGDCDCQECRELREAVEEATRT